MIASAAWLTELLLESFGCYFFWRRRVWPLWVWLGFRALADLTGMLLLGFSGPRAYTWSDYLQRQGQYALIALVSVWTVAEVLREHPRTKRAYLGLLGAIALYAVVSFHLFSPSAVQVLKFEIWAEMVLAGFVSGSMLAAALAGAKAPRPWGLISCGLVTLAGSDLAVTVLRRWGWPAEGLYPIGAIAALGILCWAGWRDYRLEAVRLELPKKFPPTSVYDFRQESRMVQ